MNDNINVDSTMAGSMNVNINVNSTMAGSMNGNINVDSTMAGSMNDNIKVDRTMAWSMNDNINVDSTMAGSMNARGELTTRKESFTTRSHLLQVSNTQIQMSTKMPISANSRKLTQTNINDIYYMFMLRNN